MAPNHVGDPLGSIFWVQKMASNCKKLPCPKIRIFDYPTVINISQKLEVMAMAQNHGWDPLGSIFGPMGSHWVQEKDQNGKKLPCPKIRIFDYRTIIEFSQKMEVTVMAPNHGGDPLGSLLGPMGSHWVQKMGQNRENLPCPQIEFSTTLQSSIFLKKNRNYCYGAKSRWSLSWVHLGANWVPMVPKNGSKPLKITMPQNSNFRLPPVIDFLQKIEVTVMAPNHGWHPLGSILGPMGSHWGPKMGQNL